MTTNPNADQKILLLRGLPGSGKSEFALNWVSKDPGWRMRTSRSDISEQLYGKFYDTVTNEHSLSTISHMQHSMVNGALKAHLSVVIDDPNLDAQTVREWMSLADRYKVPLEVKDFEVTFDEGRKNTNLPEEAFRKLYNYTVKGKLPALPVKKEIAALDVSSQEYVPNTSLPTAYICDIDGTVARMVGRSPFAYDRVHEDTLIQNVARVIHTLDKNAEVIFVTGRQDWCRDLTSDWLKDHGFTFDKLYMRPTDDTDTPDEQVKLDIFNEHIRNNYNVVGVFDDRRKVCKMWEDIGLTLFRVGPMDSDF